MSGFPLLNMNPKEKTDFIIALIVLLFFGALIFNYIPGKEESPLRMLADSEIQHTDLLENTNADGALEQLKEIEIEGKKYSIVEEEVENEVSYSGSLDTVSDVALVADLDVVEEGDLVGEFDDEMDEGEEDFDEDIEDSMEEEDIEDSIVEEDSEEDLDELDEENFVDSKKTLTENIENVIEETTTAGSEAALALTEKVEEIKDELQGKGEDVPEAYEAPAAKIEKEKVEAPKPAKKSVDKSCVIIVGAFEEGNNVTALKSKLKKDNYEIFSTPYKGLTRVGVYTPCGAGSKTLLKKIRKDYVFDAFLMKQN